MTLRHFAILSQSIYELRRYVGEFPQGRDQADAMEAALAEINRLTNERYVLAKGLRTALEMITDPDGREHTAEEGIEKDLSLDAAIKLLASAPTVPPTESTPTLAASQQDRVAVPHGSKSSAVGAALPEPNSLCP